MYNDHSLNAEFRTGKIFDYRTYRESMCHFSHIYTTDEDLKTLYFYEKRRNLSKSGCRGMTYQN